jgi:mono/diheme cytochrome c family protein
MVSFTTRKATSLLRRLIALLSRNHAGNCGEQSHRYRPPGARPTVISSADVNKIYLAAALILILGTLTFAANNDNGKRLFVKDGCYQCHGYQGQGGAAGARLAPRPIVLAALTAYVRHPTGQMPPYTSKVLSDADLADIHAYLSSIPTPPPVKDIPLLNQ